MENHPTRLEMKFVQLVPRTGRTASTTFAVSSYRLHIEKYKCSVSLYIKVCCCFFFCFCFFNFFYCFSPLHAAESGAPPIVTHMSLLGLLLAVGAIASLL